MKLYFHNFWDTNEKISKLPFWKHLFSFNDIEYCNAIEDADIVLNSVFYNNNIFFFKKKKNVFITCEPLTIENENFDLELSFHFNTENKRLLTVSPQLLLTFYNTEIPRTIFLKNRPLQTKVPEKFCCFITRQPKPERIDFFNQLSKYKQVDSLGPCLNNTGILAPDDYNEFCKLVSQYKFIITFENTQIDLYITEKILHGYFSSCIPIYWGSKYIHEIFNKDSFVYIDDYNQENIEKAIEEIKLLDNNDELYLNMVNQPVFSDGFDIDDYFQNLKKAIQYKLENN